MTEEEGRNIVTEKEQAVLTYSPGKFNLSA